MFRPIARNTLAALTVVACAVGAVVRAADPDLTLLQQRVERLDVLLQRVEAISAIKRLQHAYGHYSELGLWHDFADLFADTGIGYYTQGALDREGIRSLFLKEVGQGRLGLADGRIYPHISMQPVVTLAPDGRSGNGRWHIMAMLGGHGGTASWAGGVYENQYVLENGVWKFKEVRYHPQYSGRYEAPGWTPTRDPAPFHFEPSRVGKPIPDVAGPARAATPRAPSTVAEPTLVTLGPRMASLAARAQRLGDEIEVTNLQHAYGYYADRRMWDDAAELFADDGTMEVGLQGVYVGRSSIRRGLNAFGRTGLAAGEINDRVHLQTIVSVTPDGRIARTRGTEVGMIGAPGGRALWTQSIYENEFVKEDGRKQGGVWKIKAMRVYPRFIVDAGLGWAKDAQPAPGPHASLPPDRPPTESYEIYPRFHIAPFHFDHPVTGRPPQYPADTKARAPLRSTPSTPSAAPAVRTVAELESLLTATSRSVERSQAYHAAENLVAAYGYYQDAMAWDETAAIFSRSGWKERIRQPLNMPASPGASPNGFALHQIVQPVIHVSADGRSAKARVRLFQMGNQAGGDGAWTSGIYENTALDEGGTWKLSGVSLDYVWTAPSRGGWVRATAPPTAPQVPFHYRNPVSGRVPPVLLP
jgi:hypothetical protein